MPVHDHSFSVVEESLPHDCTLAEYRRNRPQRRIALRDRYLEGFKGLPLDADARHALGRLRQPRDPPMASDLLMRVARELAGVLQV